MKIKKSQLKELIKQTIVDLTEKTFGSKAQYDAYRKKNNLKPGSKHKVAGKTVTVRDTKKMSKKAKSLGDKMADKLNKRMADLEKKRKQGKIKEQLNLNEYIGSGKPIPRNKAKQLFVPENEMIRFSRVFKKLIQKGFVYIGDQTKEKKKISKHYTVTVDKKMYDNLLDILMSKRFKVKT